jgi:hypothetical protein
MYPRSRTTRSNESVISQLKSAFWVYAVLTIGAAPAAPARAADIPQEYVEAIRSAEAEGLALYEADIKGAAVNDKDVAEAKSRISTFCDYSYLPVRVTENGQGVLFLLAQPRGDNEMVVGRHFRIAGADVQPSTRSCLTVGLGTPARRPVAVVVTHLLSATPSAFHVYLSLKYKIGLDVGTSVGNWAVEHGSITFLAARGPPPAK